MSWKLRRRRLLGDLLKNHHQARHKGFTLTELLVTTAIAGIVVSGLLAVVVNVLRVDQREVRLSRVQQDTQRALDYISNDLQEAVYVYPDPSGVRALLNDPNMPNSAGSTDVLAFWRPTEIPEADIADTVAACQTDNPTLGATGCEELLTRRAEYSLVVYIHAPFDNALVWEGQSRLIRYELPRYGRSGGALVERAGYVDPSSAAATGQVNDFENWAPSAAVDGTDDVLVDYISLPVSTATVGATAVDCDAITGIPATYVPSPPDAAQGTGFFACVRDPDVDNSSLSAVDLRARLAAGATFRGAQDVFLFVSGDAQPADGNDFTRATLNPANDLSKLPILSRQTQVRGVVDRGTSL
ncbi:PilW family protein [Leptothoe spongobia]|uniref:Prepilin-type N-terminal cleavage/methylation domain-containing protein n=1 Tax=Leptothoe spongobia TAU-MAC 1115 TaxID=1967444 RepID=A0A947GHF8_9CYAN|nr:prepilin-type N-terminal cleavage/methylation domain-containing protein [Leptothoe spongobia]MBT9315565.1 prepilin-type N-terminal cleavage/methylation domain-containing protein [Leptothoe spongobia TAU-MAC 1115]